MGQPEEDGIKRRSRNTRTMLKRMVLRKSLVR